LALTGGRLNRWGRKQSYQTKRFDAFLRKYGASSRAFGIGKFLPSVKQDSLLEVIQ
jgi:hypothetical protein